MALRTLASLGSLAGKRVIVRADLNVPLRDGVITDDGRVRATLPTLNALIDQGARVVVVSHLGRPDGAPDPAYSLQPVAQRLSELLGAPVAFAQDTVGESAAEAVAALADGDVAVLENLRFNAGETAKDDATRRAFAEQLAALGDVLVSDGFGVVHRKQASVYDLAELLPSAAGFLIEKEVEVLDRLTENPERPYTVVLGGSKVSDKLGVIDHLLPRVDRVLVGGGMLFTFLVALGHPVGSSLLEKDQIETVKGYIARAQELGVELVLPVDAVVAASFSGDADHVVAAADALEDTPFGASGLGLDIGPKTAEQFAELIRSSRTVFWNGPMGVFELAPFAAGTKAVAQALTEVDGLSVVGGGDSAAAVRQLGFSDDAFGHISTGGGASLEFLEGKKLPGLEVLGWAQ
ncbi:MAG: phosphoglycerate kinase [Microbacterium sp.]|jgi:phosphoglycerate kinase|uniref:Phosphoglycerate kinase n=1 Tax=Microbacterium ginsengisoli TaxID=400772 RepID=A0A3C1KBW4_9MICO|nr:MULTISPECIES: phosphoglycerate kinase [unclassified Microbacterium]MAL07571.1 phosphoglycerate kinase [Microbacterium sp.]MBN9199309.1 phosphoglycerate kinase [Microbacterium ginsengisoli]MCK9917139.1 phosphoglycerate kinase [Microbacteriaceae bacterium K1510]KQR90466.1 phosphoglycerate kinase [Microbacterium sp. Leaf347]KQR91321.1 phosphoglycerate kinase [Microbacterium sp. Leaf351]